MRVEGAARLSDLKLKKNTRDFLVMYFLIRDLEKSIEEFAFGKVLDIGCGNKPYEPLFRNRITEYTGCDVVQSDKNKVDVICPATNLHFDNETFDTVFSTQVMEHVDDPSQMIHEAGRVLKLNGIAIFSVPFCWELHEEPYDFYRFTKYGIRALLEKENFKVICIYANGGKWAAIYQLNLNIIYSVFRKKSLFPYILKFIFIKLHFTGLLNRMAIWLDKKFYDELLTLNYVVVARKE